MSPAFDELFLRTALAGFDRQAHLDDLVGDLDRQLDVSAARLTFGDRYAQGSRKLNGSRL